MPEVFSLIVSYLHWELLARVYPILAWVLPPNERPVPSESSLVQCLWHNSPYISGLCTSGKKKPFVDVVPLREGLLNDPHLLMKILYEVLRYAGRGGQKTFHYDTAYSLIFPTGGFQNPNADQVADFRTCRVLRVHFNPKKMLIAVVSDDYDSETLGVYALAGKERADIGSQLYFHSGSEIYQCGRETGLCPMLVSWSPDGTKLLCIQAPFDTCEYAVVTVLVLEKKGPMRRIYCPNMPLASWRELKKSTAECWTSNNTFWILDDSDYGNLTEVKILKNAVVVSASCRSRQVIPGGCKEASMGVWIAGKTAFWVENCRTGGHVQHSIIRRQSLESPQTFPENQGLVLPTGFVLDAAVNVGNSSELLLLLLYPGGMDYCEEDNVDNEFQVIEDLDESFWPHADRKEARRGTGCRLKAPWLSKSERRQRLVLASLGCFEEKPRILSVHHTNISGDQTSGQKWRRYLTTTSIRCQTERYAVIDFAKYPLIQPMLFSKLTNMCFRIDPTAFYFPSADGSLYISKVTWLLKTEDFLLSPSKRSTPLHAMTPLETSPDSRREQALEKILCNFGTSAREREEKSMCASRRRGSASTIEKEHVCQECKKVRERKPVEEFNSPKILPLRYIYNH